jgi:hypothetical protein
MLGGCLQYTQPTPQAPVSAAQADFDAVWRASLETLRKYGFEIDRQDRRAGVITTVPMVGGQWFELGRRDNRSAYTMAENSLQSIYRIAKVQVVPRAAGSQTYRAKVEIEMWRANRRLSRITSVADAYDVFALPGFSRDYVGTGVPGPEDRVLVGRDEPLENRLTLDMQSAAQELKAGY